MDHSLLERNMRGIHHSTSGFVWGEKNYVIRNVFTLIYMSYMRTLAYFHDAVVMFPYTL